MEGRPLDRDGSDDADLVERAKRGEDHAYEELVRRYQRLAFRVAYLVTGRSADAEDAAQTAFVKAYYALHRFRAGASFRPWLLAIVSNEARNRLRSAGRQANLEQLLGRGRAEDDAAPSPEAAALAEEGRRALLAAMTSLAENDRLVIAYRYFLDLSEAEMADALGVARGTVKSRLSRALGRLRDTLGPETPLGVGATDG